MITKACVEKIAGRVFPYEGVGLRRFHSKDRVMTFTHPSQASGYTILRAATARALTATGLHPAIGIHHRNRNNLFCLVDDVMEPFRPIVDDAVCKWWAENGAFYETITPDIKRLLVDILSKDLISERGASPLINCLARTAQSIKESFQEKAMRLVLPEIPALGTLL
jgi:CRISPR-associated protein Cas1